MAVSNDVNCPCAKRFLSQHGDLNGPFRGWTICFGRHQIWGCEKKVRPINTPSYSRALLCWHTAAAQGIPYRTSGGAHQPGELSRGSTWLQEFDSLMLKTGHFVMLHGFVAHTGIFGGKVDIEIFFGYFRFGAILCTQYREQYLFYLYFFKQ